MEDGDDDVAVDFLATADCIFQDSLGFLKVNEGLFVLLKLDSLDSL